MVCGCLLMGPRMANKTRDAITPTVATLALSKTKVIVIWWAVVMVLVIGFTLLVALLLTTKAWLAEQRRRRQLAAMKRDEIGRASCRERTEMSEGYDVVLGYCMV